MAARKNFRQLIGPLALPLFCILVALIEGFLYSAGPFSVYAERGVLAVPAMVRFLAPLAIDFLLLGLLLTFLWWRHWSSMLFCSGAVFLLGVVHFVQYTALKLSGEFVSVVALHFADHAAYVLSGDLLFSFGINLLVILVILALLLRGLGLPGAPLRTRLYGAALCGSLIGLLIWSDLPSEREMLMSRHGIEFGSPVGALGQTVRAAFATELEPQPSLSKVVIDQARMRGISISPDSYIPFLKEQVYQQALPFSETGGAQKPNMIILFIESFSASVLPAYGAPHPGLTPNIDDLASKSMRVDKYLNHSTPTVLGLRGQHCSNYPRLMHFDWAKSESKPKVGKLVCMPEMFAQAGYDTIYLSHTRAGEAFMQSQFHDMGYRETHFNETIMADYLPAEKPDALLEDQPGDAQMFKILVRYLSTRQSDTPFLLSLSTIGTHLAFDVTFEEAKFGDGRSQVLDTFHELDRGFGIFWSWFKDSEYAKNTILVLTGDHVMMSNDDLRHVAGPAFRNHKFDHMGLLILDPTHELPKSFRANTTSIDLAPSLLQLVGIQNQRNTFLGLSMFSDRTAVRGGFAFAWGRDLTDWRNESDLFTISTRDCNLRLDLLEELAAGGAGPAQACLMYQVLNYAHRMEADNRMWVGAKN